MWLKRLNSRKHLLVIVFSVCYFVFAFATYKDYGITSDEQLEYRAGKTYFKYLFSNTDERKQITEKVLPKDNPESFPYFRFYPGVVAELNFRDFYEWAHLINLIFGYVGFVTVYLLVFELTQSKISVLAPLLLLLNPYYFGHIPANSKDIPFASLYLICTYLIIKLDARKIFPFVILGVFLGILTGMRFVGLTLLVVLFTRTICQPKTVYKASMTLVVASFTLFLLWPYLWTDPIHKVLSLASDAKDFSYWDRAILFNGSLLTKDHRPWYYLFTYILYKTPVLVLLGLLGSVFVKSSKIALVLAITFANLLLYLVFQPTIYNEMRHFLYLVPLLTVLASVFFIKVLEHKNKALLKVGFLIVVLGLFKMSYDFIALHPYQYVYFNELAGNTSQVAQSYEFDYWSASYKESSEFLRNLATQSQTAIKVYPCNLAFGVDYYSYKSFILVNKSLESDYIICDYQNALINHFDLEDRIVFKVIRKGAVLSYVAKTVK